MKRKNIIDYIQQVRFGYLATVDADNAPRVRPIAIHNIYGDHLYFFTFSNTRKVAEMEHHPRVEVVWSKAEEQSQIRISGTAVQEDDEHILQRFREDNPMVAKILPEAAQHLFRLYRLQPENVEVAEGLVPYQEVEW